MSRWPLLLAAGLVLGAAGSAASLGSSDRIVVGFPPPDDLEQCVPDPCIVAFVMAEYEVAADELTGAGHACAGGGAGAGRIDPAGDPPSIVGGGPGFGACLDVDPADGAASATGGIGAFVAAVPAADPTGSGVGTHVLLEPTRQHAHVEGGGGGLEGAPLEVGFQHVVHVEPFSSPGEFRHPSHGCVTLTVGGPVLPPSQQGSVGLNQPCGGG